MISSEINSKYWSSVAPSEIIGENAMPGSELFDFLKSGARVLDLGCGNGKISRQLKSSGYEVYGVDINDRAITANDSRQEGINYSVADITRGLSFENDFFDAVVVSFFLINIMPVAVRASCVAELTRVLRPGGYVWANEPITSPDYALRYEVSAPFVDEPNSFFVFRKGLRSKEVDTTEKLRQSIDRGDVDRVTRHFVDGELEKLFGSYKLVSKEYSETASPNTGYIIKMVILVLQK